MSIYSLLDFFFQSQQFFHALHGLVTNSSYCHLYNGIHSAPRTPQQNRIVERKNRTIQEMARVLLHSKNVPRNLWVEAINTACYTSNRVYVRAGTSISLYEIWNGKRPSVKQFKVFGSKCYIFKYGASLGKFDSKSDECIFLGYSTVSRAYRVYNLRTSTLVESVNVVVDDSTFDKNAT